MHAEPQIVTNIAYYSNETLQEYLVNVWARVKNRWSNEIVTRYLDYPHMKLSLTLWYINCFVYSCYQAIHDFLNVANYINIFFLNIFTILSIDPSSIINLWIFSHSKQVIFCLITFISQSGSFYIPYVYLEILCATEYDRFTDKRKVMGIHNCVQCTSLKMLTHLFGCINIMKITFFLVWYAKCL